uniref:Uncharacterized protein n=1 Tax=Anguilla anguilla TaxID=7936 RepID=A0A0E9PLU5_ANGAN
MVCKIIYQQNNEFMITCGLFPFTVPTQNHAYSTKSISG